MKRWKLLWKFLNPSRHARHIAKLTVRGQRFFRELEVRVMEARDECSGTPEWIIWHNRLFRLRACGEAKRARPILFGGHP